ncbi:amidohydrolase family protein [Cellulomonas fengjieae]|uniref:Amidohydrolase family protein n=1 Tax=Cellulomonas fengjieae TaxID=2819978 RepID=A0ABS3SBV2_9CELL|nr:amidohydrolase family protein [Cellulomonas fengjieae]MBO3083228.1 amidohydrolase family protein [Cellulomonas fengjieae]QVI65416.1 amidohydrolase family protein [Cellulomonas fengjieae]
MPNVVDAHLQVWNPEAVHYPWMTPQNAALHRPFRLADIREQLVDEGVDWVVLVQAADNRADTELMLFQALSSPRVAGVVAWVPLDAPDDAAALLDRWRREPIVGIGHDGRNGSGEPDTSWLLDTAVDDGLALLTERRLTLDVTAHTPAALAHVATLAERHPKLTIVLDHLGGPPLAALRSGDRDGWGRWSGLLGAAAEQPNVVAKLSGLTTAAGPGWRPDDLRPAVDRALEVFGPGRLMMGSDWPSALLEGDSYAQVWHGLRSTVDGLPEDARAALLGGTATQVYRLPFDSF